MTEDEASRCDVLVVASTYPVPSVAGVPSFVETLSRALATFADVSVVALARGGPERLSVSTEESVEVTRVGRRGGVPGSGALSALRIRSLAAEIILAVRWLLRVTLKVRRDRPDVLHIHWAFPVPPLIRLLRSLRLINSTVDYVVTLHGADVLLLDGRLRRLVRYGLRGARSITTVNARDQRVVETALAGRSCPVSVIPMPVDPMFFGVQRQADLSAGAFLFVGRLVPKKGIDQLLGAAEVSSSLARLRLRVVGTGPLARSLGAYRGSVDFVGPAPPSAVVTEMTNARALICPFIDLPSDREGLPVTVLEAFASGLPVIATRVAGIQELEQVGFSIWSIDNPVGPESITKAIEDFESDLARSHQHVLEAVEENRRRAARFAPDRVASEFRELLLRR